MSTKHNDSCLRSVKRSSLPILNSTLINIASFVPCFPFGKEGACLYPLECAFIAALIAFYYCSTYPYSGLCSYLLGKPERAIAEREPYVVRKQKNCI
jgi:Cu/Ag efflux pump CusA